MRRVVGACIGALALTVITSGTALGEDSIIGGGVTREGPGDAQAFLSVGEVQQGGADEATTYGGGSSRQTLEKQAESAVLSQFTRCGQLKDLLGAGGASLAAAQAEFDQLCKPGATAGTYAPPPWVLGSRAVTSLTLPTAKPVVGPDPSLNEWNMAVVGYPLWLSTAGATTMSSSASVMGYTVTLTAVRQGVTFSMGDGGSVTCTTSTPWTSGVPAGQSSPDCGYVYQEPSKPGRYRIVTTASWQVTWSVLGQSGTIPVTKYGGANLTVGELEAVVVRAGER